VAAFRRRGKVDVTNWSSFKGVCFIEVKKDCRRGSRTTAGKREGVGLSSSYSDGHAGHPYKARAEVVRYLRALEGIDPRSLPQRGQPGEPRTVGRRKGSGLTEFLLGSSASRVFANYSSSCQVLNYLARLEGARGGKSPIGTNPIKDLRRGRLLIENNAEDELAENTERSVLNETKRE